MRDDTVQLMLLVFEEEFKTETSAMIGAGLIPSDGFEGGVAKVLKDVFPELDKESFFAGNNEHMKYEIRKAVSSVAYRKKISIDEEVWEVIYRATDKTFD